MKFSRVFICFICVTSVLMCTSFAKDRLPAFADSFYPSDKDVLSRNIHTYIGNVPLYGTGEALIALMVPHAGYDYSGSVAAYGYKQLLDRRYNNVILLGSSHKKIFDGMALSSADKFSTPLGDVEVSKDIINILLKSNSKFFFDDDAHEREHSIEVQLPFLQSTLKGGFKIVPILFGSLSVNECVDLAEALLKIIDDKTLVIISSDLSHYYPYDDANVLDLEGLKSISTDDVEGYIKALSLGSTEACSPSAIITGMILARSLGANDNVLLKYANSGDTTPDKTKVVGYASVGFFRKDIKLSDADKKELLRIAGKTLEGQFRTIASQESNSSSVALKQNRGVFVTLYEGGKLRGCVGYVRPIEPLYLAVKNMTVNAALNDKRFSPVTEDELKKIEIEISVLSPLKIVKNFSDIKVGRDGLYIMKGNKSGLLLPQVPGEFGWGRDEFLRQVCVKAGIPESAYKDKDLVIYSFTADIFKK